MKKIIGIGLLVFIITTLSVASVGWFLQARNLKNMIEEAATTLNPAFGTLTLDAVETSGFPMKMMVTLRNPHGTLHLDKLLPEITKQVSAAAGNSAGVLAPPAFPQSTVAFAQTGTLIITIDALSRHVEYRSEGPLQLTFNDAAGTLPITMESEGTTYCKMGLHSSVADLFNQGWAMETLFNRQALLEQFRSIECDFPALTAMHSDTNQLLFSQAKSTISFGYDVENKRLKSSVLIAVKDSECYPAGDEAINRIAGLLSPIGTAPLAATGSLYGKQDLTLDFAMDAPQDEAQYKSAPFHITLNGLRVKNANYTIDGKATIASSLQGDQQNITFDSAFTTNFTEKQANFARILLQQIYSELEQEKFTTANPAAAALISKHGKQAIIDAVYTALPNVSQMGTLTHKLSGQFTGNTTAQLGTLTISALELSARDYALIGQAALSKPEGQALPKGTATINCNSCIALIDSLESYLQRVDFSLAQLDPTLQGSIAPKGEMAAMGKQFVYLIGNKKDQDGLNLEFVLEWNNGNLTINKRSLPEIMALTIPSSPGAAAAPAQ